MGSYYISGRNTKTGKSWRLMRQTYLNGARQKPIQIRDPMFSDLGFTTKMSIEQARQHASQLNAKNSLLKKEGRALDEQKQLASNKLNRIKRHEAAIFPKEHYESFIRYLSSERLGSDQNNKRVQSHWNRAQEILLALNLNVHELESRAHEFYEKAYSLRMSLDYTLKVRNAVNLWSKHLSTKTQQRLVLLRTPNNYEKNRVRDGYRDSIKYRGPSAPLTLPVLSELKEKFHDLPGQWEYLYCLCWTGARPSELDWLIEQFKDGLQNEVIVEQEGVDVPVLKIYQRKLVNLAYEDRFKFLPLFLPQMRKVIEYLNEGKLVRPRAKILKRLSKNKKLSLYGPRRAFFDLMTKSKDIPRQDPSSVSLWLGHASLLLTLSRYRQKSLVSFQGVSANQSPATVISLSKVSGE